MRYVRPYRARISWLLANLLGLRWLCFACWLAHIKQDRDVQMGDLWRCAEDDHWGYYLNGGSIEWAA